MEKLIKFGVISFIALVIVLIGFFKCHVTIDKGMAGIVYSMNGGIINKTLPQGFNWISPLWKVTEYPVSRETVYLSREKEKDDSFPTTTNEGKQINVDARYSYHMDVAQLPSIFNKFRGVDYPAIEAGWIKTELQKTVRNVTSGYSVFELNGSKVTEINAKVLKQLSDGLKADGIIIEDFSLGAIHPDDNTMKAIQANVDAQLALQKMEMEQKQAEILAQTKRVSAQGEADAAVIQAEGQAKANEKLQMSITDNLIKLKTIERWNGQNSQVVSGSNGSGGVFVQVQPQADTAKK